ncbi:MAG: restriction endonuclease subunit S [Ktedonobacteraceae bacterium]
MVINKNWKRVPIETLYLGLYDGPHATPKPASNGPVFLGIKNISEDGKLDLTDIRHIADFDFSEWTRRVTPHAGDIVFTYEATLNRYAIIPQGFRGCLGRRLALIRPNSEKVDTRFLFYYFFSEDWRTTISKNILSGSTVDRIPLTHFPSFKISLPPLPTQHKIAAILSAYDDLIENNMRRIAILEEMAQSLYREWFVHFRFPGHEKKSMVEPALGMIPEGWEVVKLGEVIELAYGKALKADMRVVGNILVYGSGGVIGYHNEGIVKGPGIIVGRKGNVGSVFWSDNDFFPIDTVFFVRSNVCLHYIYYNLQDQHFVNNDAAVPGLNRNQAYLLPFLLPDGPILSIFQEFIDPLFRQKQVLIKKNANLRQTRDLLLPKLIAGEVDVEGLDICIEGEKND